MVAAFIGEDSDDRLRIKEEEKRNNAQNQDEEIGESTASQQMNDKMKVKNFSLIHG